MPRRLPRRKKDEGCLGLDQARIALGLIANVADGAVSVPGLKAVAQIAVQIIDIAQKVKEYKEDALLIAGRTDEFMRRLIDDMEGKKDKDIDERLRSNLCRLGGTLEKIRTIMETQAKQGLLERVLKHARNYGDIQQCKEDIDHCVKLFQVSSQVRSEANIHNIQRQVGDLKVDVKSVKQDIAIALQYQETNRTLKEIPRWEIDLLGSKYDDYAIQTGEYDGHRVIVKRYGRDAERWSKEISEWLRSCNWGPFYLQLLGRSGNSEGDFYVVLRDPGEPVQLYVQEQCRGNPVKAMLSMVNIVLQLAKGAKMLFQEDHGGCKLDTAAVHIRPNGSPVFVNFDPCRFYAEDASVQKRIDETWDMFQGLVAKSLTGRAAQPNYVVGKHGHVGISATRISQFLLHFIWDFKFVHAQQIPMPSDDGDLLTNLFDKFLFAMRTTHEDLEMTDQESDNPLLISLQNRFSPGLCGIWDVWNPLGAEPGDLGVMLAGVDDKRPVFKRFKNVAKDIAEVDGVRHDHVIWYRPKEQLWTADPQPDGIIRYTLRLSDTSVGGKDFRFDRGRAYAKLDQGWDVTAAWSYLRTHRCVIEQLAKENDVDTHDIRLIFSYSRSEGYARLSLDGVDIDEKRDTVLCDAGFTDGRLYYFENLYAREGQVQGYWSASSEAGHPLWPSSPDAPGPAWGWEYHDSHFKVEISRKGPVEHIRYLSL